MKRTIFECLRWLAFGAVALFALIPMWDASQVVFYFIGVVSMIALFSHLTRRLFFPYVDVRKYSDKALEDPLASAIVFFSITLLLCVTLYSVTSLVGFKG